ncbi:hypothetical protein [Streptomyces olivoreticuli]|uniref:hypothetical protein n=1 Tax=Streptomyces olivoreticuli TaxID=68246 RepID=UPI000E23CCEC|nr:hypothetical protein [Streptomyces olivoreticuli]
MSPKWTSRVPTLLDCTLREGPYECRFGSEEMAIIAKQLQQSGITHIEVGAETGLGTNPQVDDIDQIRTVAAAAPGTRVGVIAGASSTTVDDLRRVVDAGAGFIRVAAAVTDSTTALPLIEAVADWNVPVTFNAIKCYAVEQQQLLSIAKDVTAAGAHVFYLVDSAGSMLPRTVHRRTAALHDLGIQVGFHGHDNLALAVANSLAALDAGAIAADGTLRGIGRSAGNAQLEVLVKAAQQHGSLTEVDGDALCRLSEELIAERRLRDRGVSFLDIAMGEGRFHSERLDLAREVAHAYQVPLESLVRATGQSDPVAPDRNLLEQTAALLRADPPAEAAHSWPGHW